MRFRIRTWYVAPPTCVHLQGEQSGLCAVRSGIHVTGKPHVSAARWRRALDLPLGFQQLLRGSGHVVQHSAECLIVHAQKA